MRRRPLVMGLAAWPALAQAQAKPQAVVGYLHSFSAAYMAPFEAALRQGLADEGYAEPRNLRIEARSAEGQYDRLPALAQELVGLKVDAIIAAGGSDPAKAAMAATAAIPIVFVSAAEPIKAGIVQSLGRPGGNVTGVALIGSALEPKRLEYLNRLAPGSSPIGALVNPGYPDIEVQVAEIRHAAATVNRPVEFVRADTEAALEEAVAAAARLGCGALAVAQEAFFNSHRSRIVALAAQYRLPAIYNQREYVERGGFASYGAHFHDGYRQAGLYVGRILKGARPADLPVMQPARFELVINLKTTRTLGLDVPVDVLAAADEVIE
jgi:putative ABC transport system substrate-binding protein